ncbi:MAG: DNA-binding transcriptional MerR regulator [Bacteriovoracaceae bacterium]|jgi:DNA-binding transcriptional MerR regulator
MIKIPNKSHFKANEVCTLTGVKPYVLRFWESEFAEISPLISSSGQKLFEHKDIEAIVLVKKLLFEDKLTIEKAKFEIQRLYALQEQSPVEEELSADSEMPPLPEEMKAMTSRNLEDNDIQKLVMAKSKLSDLLSVTQNLQERYNWS